MTSDNSTGEVEIPSLDHFIVIDWYDGIVHSVARSTEHHLEFACALVAAAPDLGIRCFLCAALPLGTFNAFAAALPESGPFTAPIGIPYLKSPSADVAAEADRQIADVERSAGSPGFYVLSKHIQGHWIGVWPADVAELERFEFADIGQIMAAPSMVWIDKLRGVSVQFQDP